MRHTLHEVGSDYRLQTYTGRFPAEVFHDCGLVNHIQLVHFSTDGIVTAITACAHTTNEV